MSTGLVSSKASLPLASLLPVPSHGSFLCVCLCLTSSSYKDTSQTGLGSPHMTSSYLITSLKSSSLCTARLEDLELGLHIMNLERTQFIP